MIGVLCCEGFRVPPVRMLHLILCLKSQVGKRSGSCWTTQIVLCEESLWWCLSALLAGFDQTPASHIVGEIVSALSPSPFHFSVFIFVVYLCSLPNVPISRIDGLMEVITHGVGFNLKKIH